MSSFRTYNTRDKANEGQRFDIPNAQGEPSGDWLTLRGVDSDEYQIAAKKTRLRLWSFLEEKGEKGRGTREHMEIVMHNQHELQAALISGWSFDETLTPESSLEFVTGAPYLGEQIDEFAGKRERFAKG